MAAGNFYVFDQFLTDMGNKIHDMDGDTFKWGLINSAANGGDDPAQNDAAPHWGGTGTTNFKTSETADTTGNYAADGPTLQAFEAVQSWTVTANILKFDVGNMQILQHANNPGITAGEGPRWAILYNSIDANKRCVGYLDLGSDIDMSAGDFNYTVPDNGLFRIGAGTIP